MSGGHRPRRSSRSGVYSTGVQRRLPGRPVRPHPTRHRGRRARQRRTGRRRRERGGASPVAAETAGGLRQCLRAMPKRPCRRKPVALGDAADPTTILRSMSAARRRRLRLDRVRARRPCWTRRAVAVPTLERPEARRPFRAARRCLGPARRRRFLSDAAVLRDPADRSPSALPVGDGAALLRRTPPDVRAESSSACVAASQQRGSGVATRLTSIPTITLKRRDQLGRRLDRGPGLGQRDLSYALGPLLTWSFPKSWWPGPTSARTTGPDLGRHSPASDVPPF